MDELVRLSTGNEELDHVLGGGFPAHSINMIVGEPGVGKTVLAEQLVFANARSDDRPIAYLTTLSEPLDKIIRYLQQFDFCDPSRLTDGVAYEAMGDDLASHGPGSVVTRLEHLIKSTAPRIIVIDSFKAIHDLWTSLPDQRRMLYDMASLLTAYETTAFLIGEYTDEQISNLPEFAVADGIIQLQRNRTTTRDERFLRVLKLRGSTYQEGHHAFTISRRGLAVFPRLVGPRSAPSYDEIAERTTSGVDGLDRMLNGGLWRGSTTILTGPPGSGKTTVSLQFALAGVRHGEPTLYLNFQENPTQLVRHLRGLGADAAEIDKLRIVYASPVELQIDSILVGLFHQVAEQGIRRIVVDALGELATAASDPQRLFNYLYALVQHFAVLGVTTMMTHELAAALVAQRNEFSRFSALCDALILLDVDYQGSARRIVRVLKARGVDHELDARELRISRHGVTVT